LGFLCLVLFMGLVVGVCFSLPGPPVGFFFLKSPPVTFNATGLDSQLAGLFSFLYLKKIKFQKYMAVSINCKNNPPSPIWGATGTCRPSSGRQGPFCKIFYFQTDPWRGRDGRGPDRPSHGRQGAVARPTGDRVQQRCMAHELELPWTTHAAITHGSLAAAAQA